MISSWARMCKILGKDFEKYLPVVMGPVLKTASFKPEIAVVDEEEAKEISDDEDWQFVTIGDQVNTPFALKIKNKTNIFIVLIAKFWY
jgi:hypothetical protein